MSREHGTVTLTNRLLYHIRFLRDLSWVELSAAINVLDSRIKSRVINYEHGKDSLVQMALTNVKNGLKKKWLNIILDQHKSSIC